MQNLKIPMRVALLSCLALAAMALLGRARAWDMILPARGGFGNCGGLAERLRPPPLQIAREGYVFAGGKYSSANGPQMMSGQIYAEFQIPAVRKHRYPILMIHGGNQTGTNFTGTPDGREGWAQFFLRQGYAVYVMDQAGRGRSAYQAGLYGQLPRPTCSPRRNGLRRSSGTISGRKRICTRSGRGRAFRAIRSSTSFLLRRSRGSRTMNSSSN